MKSKPADARLGLGLWGLVVIHLMWRLVCFTAQPLNLSTWPGAGFEASAFAASGLLVIWLVLAEGDLRWRTVGVLAIYAGFRGLQDAGVLLHSRGNGFSGAHTEIAIFRFADDEAICCSFVLALAVRWLTGLQISRNYKRDAAAALPQFRLIHIFLLMAVVAALLGLARSTWFQQLGAGGFGEHRIIFLHAVTIALALFPALLILLPKQRWWSRLLMLISYAALPLVVVGYFHFSWFPWEWQIVKHMTTVVVGTFVAAGLSATIARWSGYRLCVPAVATRAKLPEKVQFPGAESV